MATVAGRRPAGSTGIWTTKPIEAVVADVEAGKRLKRCVGLLDLTALGLGAIIGTGIFVVVGEAVGLAGPAIVLSFALAGITCVFSALSYAELASSLPVSGSAYTYGYATLGELLAWIIGWDLILEYGISIAAVAVGWGAYLSELLDSAIGVTLPAAIANPPGEGGVVNIPAAFLVLAVTAVLCVAIRESARTNSVMVVVKLSILAVFIVLGLSAFKADNLTPFMPEGLGGAWTAASLIFFAYIGFDAVSTSGEETRRPARDLPIAIVASLVIATLIYIVVALVAVGGMPYTALDGDAAPLATVLADGAGLGWGASMISVGALVAITSVVLTILYGQTRILYAMSRDGLLPRSFGAVSDRTRTPIRITVVVGVLAAGIAAMVPLTQIVELVNIGTLFAFIVVNVGVLVLRRTRPDLERRFRVPLVPVLPLIGAALCVYLMTELPAATWIRFGLWMVIGLAIYVAYGRSHSRLRRGDDPDPEPAPAR